jgi:5-methylcytosine-specific restriction endonuclease McrA
MIIAIRTDSDRTERPSERTDLIAKKYEELKLPIYKIHDYKGDLTISWLINPTQKQIDIASEIWETLGNECITNVYHLKWVSNEVKENIYRSEPSEKLTYKEQLKDGRWQRKRLEIMERDGFKCRCCKSTNDLTVHHLYYLPNTLLWEYENEGMVTICKTDHDKITFELAKLGGLVAFKILTGEFDLFNELDYRKDLKP